MRSRTLALSEQEFQDDVERKFHTKKMNNQLKKPKDNDDSRGEQ